MRKQWSFALAAVVAAALIQPVAAQDKLEPINGRVQAINAEQIVLVTENGTTFIKMTPEAAVTVVKPARDGQGGPAAEGAPGKTSDVELGSPVTVYVTRTGDGTPVASKIAVEAGG